MFDSRQHIVACHMGVMPYEPAWALQREIQSRLVAAKKEDPPRTIDHVLILCQHPPVFTLGKSGDRKNLLASRSRLEAEGASLVQIDRGGDITYHGPGQIVGYPILDLDRFYTDIHRYLRDLEEVIIRTCLDYNLQTTRIEGRTGVWIPADSKGPERKIAAMGIRCSRWVTMHGFAFNVNTNLDHFNMIVPCGIADRGVTSLRKELGSPVSEDEVEKKLAARFTDVFSSITTNLDRDAADAFLQVYLSGKAV